MSDSRTSKGDSAPKDELKKIMDHLTILSSKINLSLVEFERKINIDEKKNVLNKLNSLVIQFKDIFKLAQNQYCISPKSSMMPFLVAHIAKKTSLMKPSIYALSTSPLKITS